MSERDDDFWRDIIYKDGKLDEQAVLNELADYRFLLREVPIVYEHVTGGRMSYTTYFAHDVIREHDDQVTKQVDEACKEAEAERDALKVELDALKSIVATEDTCFGSPRFANDRLPIECVARSILESGVTVAEQMEDYGITEAQVNAAAHWWQAVGEHLSRMFERRYPKVARLKAERDTALSRVATLEAAIRAHKAGIYGEREPKCKYNRVLYALLNTATEANTPKEE
jgi:uncharacterized protein (DUF433 family)